MYSTQLRYSTHGISIYHIIHLLIVHKLKEELFSLLQMFLSNSFYRYYSFRIPSNSSKTIPYHYIFSSGPTTNFLAYLLNYLLHNHYPLQSFRLDPFLLLKKLDGIPIKPSLEIKISKYVVPASYTERKSVTYHFLS